MEINDKELIEIEQRLLKTITGNGLAIHKFIEWIKSNNSYIPPRPRDICPRCSSKMESPPEAYHKYYCPSCKLGFND